MSPLRLISSSRWFSHLIGLVGILVGLLFASRAIDIPPRSETEAPVAAQSQSASAAIVPAGRSPQAIDVTSAVERLEADVLEVEARITKDPVLADLMLAKAGELDEDVRIRARQHDSPAPKSPPTTTLEQLTTRAASREATVDEYPTSAEISDAAADVAPANKAEGSAVAVILADHKDTLDMHDDSTILQQPRRDGNAVLNEDKRLWIGGDLARDYNRFDGLMNLVAMGHKEDRSFARRAELLTRYRATTHSELNAAFDIDSTQWSSLYWRYVDFDSGQAWTVGNQDEPIGLAYQVSSKFATAMERAAPTTAFGDQTSLGLQLNGIVGGDFSSLRGSRVPDSPPAVYAIGIFGPDIEDDNDTDLAVSGRWVQPFRGANNEIWQAGVSGSVRRIDSEAITASQEVHLADPVNLATHNADRQYALAAEWLWRVGPVHAQAELLGSAYRGGSRDAEGLGGYLQVGYIVVGEERPLIAQWGRWGPLGRSGRPRWEIYSRLSSTYASGDDHSNRLDTASLGSNFYYRNLRASLALVRSAIDKRVESERHGSAVIFRIQYLF